MKRWSSRFIITFFLFFALNAASEPSPYCQKWHRLLKHACVRINQTWFEGSTDLFLSGYAWHNRYTYKPEKIKTYNENAYGGGLGRSFTDEQGDTHGLFAFGFSDSHQHFEPVLGYGFLKNLQVSEKIKLGAGFTALITARPDINKGNPFPGALPLLGLQINRATLFATYVPGGMGAGNVLFIFAKWQLVK